MKIIFLIFIIIGVQNCLTQDQPVIRCEYSIEVEFEPVYYCKLTLINPNGFNNFTKIEGTHIPGKTDKDVEVVVADTINSYNVPKIICETFTDLDSISFFNFQKEIFVHTVEGYSFSSCKKLKHLNLNEDNIQKIEENAFENLGNLKSINLGWNQIRELPPNIFKPLVNLVSIYMFKNNLEVIHENFFSTHLKLTDIDFEGNNINAISPALIDNTAVEMLNLSENICIDSIFYNLPKETMKERLKKCIDNYSLLGALEHGSCSNDEICD